MASTGTAGAKKGSKEQTRDGTRSLGDRVGEAVSVGRVGPLHDGEEDFPLPGKLTDCPICGGSGFVPTMRSGVQVMVPCECRERVVLRRKMILAGVPDDETFLSATFDLDPKVEVREQSTGKAIDGRAFFSSYAQRILEMRDTGSGLLLRGPLGVGKTCIAVAILKEALKAGLTCKFVTAEGYMAALKASFDSPEARCRFEYDFNHTDVWVLDEFGSEHRVTKTEAQERNYNSWLMASWENLFRTTPRRQLFVITSNLTAEDLKKMYSDRVLSLLKARCATFTVYAKKDLREKAARRILENLGWDKYVLPDDKQGAGATKNTAGKRGRD